jgi:chemotaxis protein MotA
MISLPIGLISFIFILIASAGHVKLSDYMNAHSVIIVFAGTLAVLAIGNPVSVVKSLFHNVFALFKRPTSLKERHDELMKLAVNRGAIQQSSDPLIQYSLSLWERGVDANTFQALLSQFRDKLESDDAEAISAIHNLAKYPPALGMMGTVMGMISLFSHLGESDKSALGPSLATAMTATFYGLLAANALLNPLADRLTVDAIHRKKYYNLVYEMITLINRREPLNMIEEELTNREAA